MTVNWQDWRTWVRTAAWIVYVIFTIRYFVFFGVRSPAAPSVAVILSLVLFAIAVILNFLPNRPFLLLKIAFAGIVVYLIRRFNFAAMCDDIGMLSFGFVIVLFMISTRTCRESWDSQKRPWWPAVKRTLRRGRGDWGEEETRPF